jgi:hypothetical protein
MQAEYVSRHVVGEKEGKRKSRLEWFGHLERKDAEDWVTACRNMATVGNAGKGRSKKRWNDL